MSKQEQINELIYRFKHRGIVAVMRSPPNTIRFFGSISIRQSPRHRGDRPTMESYREVPVTWTIAYINPRLSGFSEVHLVKNAKYLILLPPIYEDLVEEGELLECIPNLKY